MNEFDVIIIGAGLGGLTAGAKLSLKGKKVLVIEQHSVPGGCATTFLRKGCKFEVGLHAIDGLDKEDMKTSFFNELKIFENVNLIKLPEFYRYVAGDFSVTIEHNIDKTIEELCALFPEEKKGIIKFFKQVMGIRRNVNRFCSLPAFKRLCLMPLAPFVFPYLVFNLYRTLGGLLDSLFKNEQLKAVFNANVLYYSDNPYKLSLIYYSTGNGSYFKAGSFIQGGSQELSNYLGDLITKNGGRLIFNFLVTKIITEKNKAIGVEYIKKNSQTGEPIQVFANTIIANAAIPLVAEELLDGANSKMLKRKISKLKNSISLLTVYLLFDKPLNTLGNSSYTTFVENDNVKSLKDFHNLNLGDFSQRPYIFTDYSQIDSKLTPDDKSFAVIVCNDNINDWDKLNEKEYQNKKDQVTNILIDRVNKLIPGIKEHIIYSEAATAKTVQKYISTPGGAIYGFDQIVRQAALNRIGHKSPIKNLYFAGAWSFPGGGFTGAMVSGNMCARDL